LKKDGEQSGRRRGREVDNEVESRLADIHSSEHQERGKNKFYAWGGVWTQNTTETAQLA